MHSARVRDEEASGLIFSRKRTPCPEKFAVFPEIGPRDFHPAPTRFPPFIATSNLPCIRLHDTRHSHATHMLQSSINPKIASARLGHSNVVITLDL